MLGREKEYLYFSVCQELLETLCSALIACVCLSCLLCPSVSKVLYPAKIPCAGEGTKKVLAICQSNLLPLPTWCAQMDGCRARGTSHGPPPGQTRIYDVASVCPFSLSFVGEGRKINLFVLFSHIPDLCSQQCKNPHPKESAPKFAQEMEKK